MKEWQHGYELDYLRRFAAVFKAAFSAHSYGAFGVPKERDIAQALHVGSLAWTSDADGAPSAVAILRVCSQASKQHDFSGRAITTSKGDVQVKAIAGTAPGMRRLIEHAVSWDERPVWIEIFEEEPLAREVMEAAAAERIATKIAASSDVKGLYLIGGGHKHRMIEAQLESDSPGLAMLDEEFLSARELKKVRAEIARAGFAWADHYSSYNKRHTWTAVALRGYDQADSTFIIKPGEMSKGWKAENPERLDAQCGATNIAERFPALLKIVARLPGEPERVRLMRLGDGAGNGELTRHADITDRDAGTRDGRISRVHIPIETNPSCLFHSWDLDGVEHVRHFAAGSLFYLDIRKPHAVRNDGEADRVHLVVDLHSSTELRAMIEAGA